MDFVTFMDYAFPGLIVTTIMIGCIWLIVKMVKSIFKK